MKISPVFPFVLLVAFFATTPVWSGETVEVRISESRFQPDRISIKPGDTVKWVNNEKRNNHSVWFKEEGLESDRFFPGESWTRTFDKPGLYRYTCGPHPEMTGEVEVAP